MSKYEKIVYEFLTSKNIQFDGPDTVGSIKGIPFNQTGYYSPDFYIPSLDLYIEVKGLMTLHMVEMMKYMLSVWDGNYIILQMTEEDWIEPYCKSKHKSIEKKIQQNIEKQLSELVSLSTADLVDLSKKRLDDYIKYRNGSIARWKAISAANNK